jgi:2-aminoadipate transaminase
MTTTAHLDAPTVAGPSLLSGRASASRSSVIRELLKLVERPGILSLAGGLPAPDGFPVEQLRAAANDVLDSAGVYGPAALQYGPTEGVQALRELLAARNGVDAEQVVVTTGSQQALDLIGRVLLDPGDAVVVEAPSYLGALQAFATWEPRFVALPSDADGLRVDVLAERLAGGLRPKLCYVVANFQNPSGSTLARERRVELARLSDEYGFVVVEDDPYGALRFTGEVLPPVRSFGGCVVSLGTASKVLAPGLRVGWALLPEWLVGPFVRAKQAADLHTSTLSQHLVLRALADARTHRGHLAANVVRYGERATALHAALVAELGEQLEVAPASGGMFLWGRFTDPRVDSERLLDVAVAEGVAFVPGTAFYLPEDAATGRRHARFSFATLLPDDLAVAAERLARAVRAGA